MKNQITKRQKELLVIIYGFIKDSGYPPTFEEMKEELGVSSNQSILDLLSKLEQRKLIKKQVGTARGIVIKPKGYEILNKPSLVAAVGVVAAGPFMEAVEIKGEWQTISKEVSRFQDDVYILKISGDSMINAGIDDGDLVLVQKKKEFCTNDIVVAQTPDGATVKRFISEDKPPYVYLKPENLKYKNIYFTEEMRMEGKVISILKNGKWQPIQYATIKTALPVKNEPLAGVRKKPFFETKDIKIYKEDFLKITSIPNNSIDLTITSPPYNVDIHYNSHVDNLSYEDYLEFTQKWIKKCYDLTKSEGRFLLNIPLDKNKGGQKSVGADITKIAKDIGWKYHSTIIWNEGNISRRTAWGSFMSASAPYVIAPVELILVLYKDSWKKTSGSRKNDITKKEFMDWTNGVWTFSGQNKKGAGGHPAPFPIELPRRCIKLFSFIGDTVLDPFLGSGSTLIASYLLNRKGIGVDIDKAYCDIAIRRLQQDAKMNQLRLLK